MNDQSPLSSPQSEPLTRREERQKRREARQASLADPSRGGAWVAGLLLIVLGGAFLLQNAGVFTIPLTNWWALFIMIPAVGAFDTAGRMYRNAGNHLTAPARSSLFIGLILTLVTLSFLFNLSWTVFGPVLLILTGVGLAVNAMLPDKKE